MKTLTFYFCFALLPTFFISAQVGIGNTNPNATLDISASNQATPANTDGILIPKIDEYPAVNPTSAQDGMLVYVTGNGSIAKGFYYWDSFAISWIAFSGSTIEKIDDLIDGKSDSDGTDDGSSIFLGINSGATDDGSDNRNIAVGYESLMANTSGFDNIAIGYRSLFNNIDGFGNEAIGYNALLNNIDGDGNIAIGRNTLHNNSSGSFNAAIGYRALFRNTTGENNTAIGRFAIHDNREGSLNTGIGDNAMSNMSSGDENVSFGANSLNNNTTGSQNTSIGTESLYDNTGNGNVAIGFQSGLTNTGSNNIFIGNNAGVNSFAVNNKLYIENLGSTIPLVYGEFDNDLIQVNGTFQINNPITTGYQFPAADGLVGTVLQTDGNGNLSFVDVPDADIEWSKTGNSATDSSVNFIGTTDTQDLSFRTNNVDKIRLTQKGQLEFLNTGNSVFIGEGAGANDDLINNVNTFVGTLSGNLNTTGSSNSFFGAYSGVDNTLGTGNSFFGFSSGRHNISGSANSFFGVFSGDNNTDGTRNSFFGSSSGTQNTTGNSNSFFGSESGFNNLTGEENSFFGSSSGAQNTAGNSNSFFGHDSGFSNSIGEENSFFGFQSGYSNTIGNTNVAIGSSALYYNELGNENVAIGTQAGSGAIGNSMNGGVFIGYQAGLNESNSNRLYIANTSANANSALIYGEFDARLLRTNAQLQVGSPSNTVIDGRIQIFSDANSSVDIDPLTGYIFNEQGRDADFRVESDTNTHLLFLDASDNVVRFGEETSALSENGNIINGRPLVYVADFETSGSTNATTVGIGSAEYIADAGSNQLVVEGDWQPANDNFFDLGSAALRWDNVYATNGTIITSDIRYKKNIQNIRYGLNEVLQLNPISFQWKEAIDNKVKLGFSAQQLQELIPEVVKDHYYTIPEDGSLPIKKQADKLGVYYSDIIPVLVKAIQEQDEKIKNLEARLLALENN